MKQLNNKGITLVALIITIIILLILAGVSISLINGQGLFERSKSSSELYKIAQYKEEIEFAVTDEKMERASINKSELFITSLANKLSKDNIGWIKSTSKCTEESGVFEEKLNDSENNILVIITNENDEIVIDVDNVGLTARIRDNISKAQDDSIIRFNSNGGTGTEMSPINVSARGTVQLSLNSYTREGYTFKNWNTRSDGTGDTYEDGDTVTPVANMTLYAQWSEILYKIEYNSNTKTNAEKTTNNKSYIQNIEIIACPYTYVGAEFVKWNTNADGTGTNYQVGDIYSTNADLTLYAIWNYTSVAASSITSNDYGRRINTGITNIDSNVADNWKVFLVDESYVYLLYGDFYPQSALPSYTGITIDSSGKCSSNALDVIPNYINTTSNWSDITDAFKTKYGNSLDISTTGGISLEQFYDSTAMTPYKQFNETQESLYYIRKYNNGTYPAWWTITRNSGTPQYYMVGRKYAIDIWNFIGSI